MNLRHSLYGGERAGVKRRRDSQAGRGFVARRTPDDHLLLSERFLYLGSRQRRSAASLLRNVTAMTNATTETVTNVLVALFISASSRSKSLAAWSSTHRTLRTRQHPFRAWRAVEARSDFGLLDHTSEGSLSITRRSGPFYVAIFAPDANTMGLVYASLLCLLRRGVAESV
jgi:hypothetical protein